MYYHITKQEKDRFGTGMCIVGFPLTHSPVKSAFLVLSNMAIYHLQNNSYNITNVTKLQIFALCSVYSRRLRGASG